jgi:hypothetical protein
MFASHPSPVVEEPQIYGGMKVNNPTSGERLPDMGHPMFGRLIGECEGV